MTSAKSVRAFLALIRPEAWREPYEELISRFKEQVNPRAVKIIPFKNAHLTLRFFGSIASNALGELNETLGQVSRHFAPFNLQVDKVGAFPNSRRPRVLWIGLGASPILTSLNQAITLQTSDIGKPPENRSFAPHLTIARIKEPDRTSLTAIDALTNGSLPPFPPWTVKSIELMQSNLSPRGPAYTILRTFVLPENRT